jgi:hypothetical protein
MGRILCRTASQAGHDGLRGTMKAKELYPTRCEYGELNLLLATVSNAPNGVFTMVLVNVHRHLGIVLMLSCFIV